jgi:cell division protein FtsL
MKTLFDKNTQEDQERALHNSKINERYREILGTVEGQFGTEEPEMNVAPVLDAPIVETRPNAPAVEQTPRVTEYTPTGPAASLFTTETLDRMSSQPVEDTFAPTVIMPQAVEAVAPVVEKEATYSLTPMAKVVMAVFAATVIIMLALIGVNSQTIQRKSIRLKNLEEKKQELVERNEEVQRYIAELQTEESILQRATEAGILN